MKLVCVFGGGGCSEIYLKSNALLKNDKQHILLVIGTLSFDEGKIPFLKEKAF